jgi:hypothetical protein
LDVNKAFDSNDMDGLKSAIDNKIKNPKEKAEFYYILKELD